MARTQGLMQGVSERPSAETMEGCHRVSSKKTHHPPRETAIHSDASELFPCQHSQLMWDTAMPSCVVPIKVFHTPRLFSTAQPGVLLTAFARDTRVGKPQLPVRLPAHLHLPVLAAFAEALLADYIQGGVKAGFSFWDILPDVCVGGRVSCRRDDQLWVRGVSIKDNICSIYEKGIRNFSNSHVVKTWSETST